MKARQERRGHGKEIAVLERNKQTKGASAPDYVGEIVIDEVPYYLSIWEDDDTRTLAVRRVGGAQ